VGPKLACRLHHQRGIVLQLVPQLQPFELLDQGLLSEHHVGRGSCARGTGHCRAVPASRCGSSPPTGDIRVLAIRLAFVAPDMTGDQFLVVIDAQMLRIRLQRYLGADEAGWYRIAVALAGDSELAVGAHRQHPADIKQTRIDRPQLGEFLGSESDRRTLGFPVQAEWSGPG
jgi:hypothetical protein